MARRQGRGRNDRGSPSGRLRIVAGKWRSRLLPVADVDGLRPTSERIRETLFNWLSDRIQGAACLDLFAGTGALGFEALSRGAASATMVEASPDAARALREAATTLSADGAEIVRANAFEFLRGAPRPFDVVFLDPPFADDCAADLCRLLIEGGWLARGARVYLEQDRERGLPDLPESLEVLREKTAGQVRYALLATDT